MEGNFYLSGERENTVLSRGKMGLEKNIQSQLHLEPEVYFQAEDLSKVCPRRSVTLILRWRKRSPGNIKRNLADRFTALPQVEQQCEV
jgi:hypothetical protein